MTTQTSKRALSSVKRDEWYGKIRTLMVKYKKRDWCISEIAHALNEQRSTVSARLNEMKGYKWVEKTGERPSTVTGIMSEVYKLHG